MFFRLAHLVTHRWMLIVAIWLAAVGVVRVTAPRWDNITHDGDFAYLPADMPSVVGERWMSEAFPRQRGRSQVVVAIAREHAAMTRDDIGVAYDVARRLKNLFAAARLAQARELASKETELRRAGKDGLADHAHAEFSRALQQADDALQDALSLDERLAAHWAERIEANPAMAPAEPPRLAEIYHNRALLNALTGNTEAALEDRSLAGKLNPSLSDAGDYVLPKGAATLPVIDVWTWREDYFGDKLVSRDHCVRLVVLQLTSEFMAVDNIAVVEQIEAELAPVRKHVDRRTERGLSVVQSGSAAVGADLLRTAASSIKHTELFTMVLVVLILAFVYRAPLLVVLPVVTILVSLLVSTGLVALLTQLSSVPGFGWWTLKVFSTTRIFVVVILFGAGTDYCLFLIARYKEELESGLAHDEAVSAALAKVGDALLASALTTVLGLSMMFFAEFGKFRFSGPVIALCLAVTLLTCTTLTPALMTGLGPALFWPFGVKSGRRGPTDSRRGIGTGGNAKRGGAAVWHFIARYLVRRPGSVLLLSVLALSPLAAYGVVHGRDVTYDFLSGLPRKCPSKQGAEALRPHFPVGESGPVTVLVKKEQAGFQSPEGREQIRDLSDQLHRPGVQTVRSVEDPLGDYEPGEKPGILSSRGRRLRMLRAHPRTKEIFVAQAPELAGDVARFEVILKHNPFSRDAIQVVDRIEDKLQALTQQTGTFWSHAEYALTGTTAGIRDLRAVTRRDNIRIKTLVVFAVLAVLFGILKSPNQTAPRSNHQGRVGSGGEVEAAAVRRPLVCLYLMATVLFSYYITMGITTVFFSMAYGNSYQGLDWKVPLFLFVILVAVGQDYNLYLITRVFEEQRRLGPYAGLRRAVVRTGGIITSCGVIMAGTFFSMTSGAWGSLLPFLPEYMSPPYGVLRSVVEMGFALTVGVLLDTFVVRPILVPSFLTLSVRWRKQMASTAPRKS
ncbi:MAG: MMPL family transporter [Planctomycetota bacterium]